jgi:hypothetical protein
MWPSTAPMRTGWTLLVPWPLCYLHQENLESASARLEVRGNDKITWNEGGFIQALPILTVSSKRMDESQVSSTRTDEP